MNGMTVDAAGDVWSARWDGGCLVHYRPDGTEAQRIPFPVRKVSSITFGGEGWDGALPTLAEEPGGQVFVALYDVTSGDETTLDQWESATTGLYRKVRVRVATLDGEVTAWVYVLNDFEGGMPSARTIGILADAAEAAGAPDDYIAELRSRPCVSGW